MSNQSREALLIDYRHARAVVAEYRKRFGERMAPEVKALLDERVAAVAALERQLGKTKTA